MVILIDSNQCQSGSHSRSNSPLHRALQRMGHQLYVGPVPYGDYILLTDEIKDVIKTVGPKKVGKKDLRGHIRVSVDRKNSLSEICGNICGGKSEHERFREEIKKAQEDGCKLYILIEDEKVKSIGDVFVWKNPRITQYYRKREDSRPKKPPASGQVLAKAMITMEAKYGITFVFASAKQFPEKLIELLEGRENADEKRENEGDR